MTSAVSQLSLGLRDAVLRLSGGVNTGGMLTPYAVYQNSGERARTDSSTEGMNLSSYGDYIAQLEVARRALQTYGNPLRGFAAQYI